MDITRAPDRLSADRHFFLTQVLRGLNPRIVRSDRTNSHMSLQKVTSLSSRHGPQNILDEPEEVVLLRMTKLVEHLFHVPIAYMALLQSDLTVVRRIGSGQEFWNRLKQFPAQKVLAEAVIWADVGGDEAEQFDFGDLRFVASAPLRSSDGLDVGLLVIADVAPRPEFSPRDLETLAELAGVLAGKMELRWMAFEARDSESTLGEAENRFLNIANCAPVMIIFSGTDGGSSFVNNTWLEFTGRSLDEELGDGYAESFHPDHRERVMREYWTAFEARRPVTIELPMRRHDGEYRWMQARGVPRLLDNGQCAGYIGCFMDLTDARTSLTESGADAERNKPDKPA